jgi:hypothetical protein
MAEPGKSGGKRLSPPALPAGGTSWHYLALPPPSANDFSRCDPAPGRKPRRALPRPQASQRPAVQLRPGAVRSLPPPPVRLRLSPAAVTKRVFRGGASGRLPSANRQRLRDSPVLLAGVPRIGLASGPTRAYVVYVRMFTCALGAPKASVVRRVPPRFASRESLTCPAATCSAPSPPPSRIRS